MPGVCATGVCPECMFQVRAPFAYRFWPPASSDPPAVHKNVAKLGPNSDEPSPKLIKPNSRLVELGQNKAELGPKLVEPSPSFVEPATPKRGQF